MTSYANWTRRWQLFADSTRKPRPTSAKTNDFPMNRQMMSPTYKISGTAYLRWNCPHKKQRWRMMTQTELPHQLLRRPNDGVIIINQEAARAFYNERYRGLHHTAKRAARTMSLLANYSQELFTANLEYEEQLENELQAKKMLQRNLSNIIASREWVREQITRARLDHQETRETLSTTLNQLRWAWKQATTTSSLNALCHAVLTNATENLEIPHQEVSSDSEANHCANSGLGRS